MQRTEPLFNEQVRAKLYNDIKKSSYNALASSYISYL